MLGWARVQWQKRERMREKRKGTRERGQGYLSQRDKGLPLDGEETDVAHRQMVVDKLKGETRC